MELKDYNEMIKELNELKEMVDEEKDRHDGTDEFEEYLEREFYDRIDELNIKLFGDDTYY